MGSYGPPTRNTCITTTHLPVRSYVSGMTIAPVTYCTMRSRKYTRGHRFPGWNDDRLQRQPLGGSMGRWRCLLLQSLYRRPVDKNCRTGPHVASCAFGGDKLDTLYITTARAGLSEEQLEEYPLSGSVFCCKPGAKGVPANCFH